MNAEDIFQDANIAESNWFKFKEVGDAIYGTLTSVKDQAGDGNFDAQKIYELMLDNGEYWFVGISRKKSKIVDAAKRAKIGQIIGFKFVESIPSKTKGFNDTKVIELYLPKGKDGEYLMNEDYNAEEVITDDGKEIPPFEG